MEQEIETRDIGLPPRRSSFCQLLLVDDIGIAAHNLGEKESEEESCDTASEEDPKHVRRANVVGERVEYERGDDSTTLAARGGHSMCECAEPSRENFSWVEIGGRICAKVEEELEESKVDDEGGVTEFVESTSEDSD
jgi:hypothetical protein